MPSLLRAGGELPEHRLAQLPEHVVVHAEVLRPRRLRGIEVEARAAAEFPVVGLAGDAGVARAGVAGHEHEPELRRDALRAGLDGEGLLGAGEARQIEQHRHLALLRLRRLIDREAHRQADHLRLVAVEPLRAAKAAMLADGFERHRYSIRRPRRLPPHYESDPRRARKNASTDSVVPDWTRARRRWTARAVGLYCAHRAHARSTRTAACARDSIANH